METTTTQRTSDRTRAMRRLRAMTIGTALAGVAATGGFAWLAATTYDGTTTEVVAVVPASTTTGTTTSTGTIGTSGATSSATPTATTSSTGTVSAASGQAHVTTGGS